jgi:hypothetical protein
MKVPVPWWRMARLLLLFVALGIGIAKDETIPTVIVAVLIIPYVAFLTVWFIVARRRTTNHPQRLSAEPELAPVELGAAGDSL